MAVSAGHAGPGMNYFLLLALWPHRGPNIATRRLRCCRARGPSAYAVGPGNSNDRAMYIKNLRDSGYDSKDDFDKFGNERAVGYGGG